MVIRNRLVLGILAGVAGAIAALVFVFAGTYFASDQQPGTTSLNPDNGLIGGSVDYGTRRGGDTS